MYSISSISPRLPTPITGRTDYNLLCGVPGVDGISYLDCRSQVYIAGRDPRGPNLLNRPWGLLGRKAETKKRTDIQDIPLYSISRLLTPHLSWCQSQNPTRRRITFESRPESSVSVCPHSNDSPSAHRTSELPVRNVSLAPTSLSVPRLGLTSTRSTATRLPVSCTLSQIKSPSRSVNPPLTGVPVLGAHIGSSASTSNDRWIGVSLPICANAISTTRPMPYLKREEVSYACLPTEGLLRAH